MVFDLDETLVEQRSAATAAVLAWAAQHGITGAEVGERWAAMSSEYYARYQRRELTFAEQRRERVRHFLGRHLAADVELDALFADYLSRYEAGWRLFDDAVPAVRRARSAGLVVAVLTNGDRDQQQRKVTQLGLEDEIDVMVASSELPAGKPDPRAFHHALAVVGASGDQTLMVGDSVTNDVEGALACGVRALLLDRHDVHRDSRLPRITSLDELTFAGNGPRPWTVPGTAHPPADP